MRFSDIPGQEDVKARLRRMVDDNKLPHALLLFGAPGAGKLMLARALVQYLHCTNRTADGDSCGRCPSCLQHGANGHVDLHYTFPTLKKSEKPGASDEFLEQWVEFLDEDPYADITVWLRKLDKPNGQPVIYVGEASALSSNLSFTARVSPYKTAIVWLPERFQTAAANKLLKLIEEPFPDTKIILVSDDARSILPTIYSRLQRIEVKKLESSTLAAELSKLFPGLTQEEAADIAHASDGNMITARNMSSGASNDVMLGYFMKLMRMAFQRKIVELKRWSEEMASLGREGQMKFLDYCCRLLRENFITNTGIKDITLMTRSERDFGKNFAKFLTSSNIFPLINDFEKAGKDIAANGNAKLIFFDLALHVVLHLKN